MEETFAFIAQMYIEAVHAETYGMMFYTLYDEEKIARLHEEAENAPYMKAKIAFMEKWMWSDAPFVERILAFACAEGIFFSTLFSIIFWLKKKNVMKGVVFSNGLIAPDESLHRNYGCYLFKKRGGLPVDRAMEIINEAYRVEDGFIDWLIGDGVEDLTAPEFKEFLKCVTDSLIYCAGYPTVYNVKNPLTWMDDIALISKENIFEIKGANYTRMSPADAADWERRAGKTTVNNNLFTDPTVVDF
jgi:ribonucleoside-diphosphate reductase subunit M2